MKILLTGYKGFIGSHLLKALENEGHHVSVYEWGEILPSIMSQDWVIHVGAISATTEKDVEKVLSQNYDFSIQLYNACKEYGVNFQYASSASVYGLNREFTEESPVDPRTPYAWSKYLFERYVKRNPVKYSIAQGFRYFNVYGSGEEHKGSQASPFTQFAKQYKETGKVKLFTGSGTMLRDFVPVEQVVKTHLDFLKVKESGVWNVGTGTTKSFLDVAKMVAPESSFEFVTMPEILSNSYQYYTCADMSKTIKTLS
jgi:ADP-L-glycero-D-manno-heptose 6-epimerase